MLRDLVETVVVVTGSVLQVDDHDRTWRLALELAKERAATGYAHDEV